MLTLRSARYQIAEISIGLPIAIPEHSSACVFPALQPGPNTEDRAVFLTDRDHPNLDQVYQMEECVMLREQPGEFTGNQAIRPAACAARLILISQSDAFQLGKPLVFAGCLERVCKVSDGKRFENDLYNIKACRAFHDATPD